MSRPIREQSHAGATTTGPGDPHSAKGHNSLGLFVVAKSLDTANDTLDVELQVEVADGEWAPIHNESGTKVGQITVTEFSNEAGSANNTALLYVHGVPAPRVRANITAITDAANGDLSVDTYVLAANNGGTGHEYLDA